MWEREKRGGGGGEGKAGENRVVDDPSKNELARSCKICARILHARLAWHVHAICPFSCTTLAQSCTYLARNCARFCKSCCKNNYLHFLLIFCKILQELVQDCARKGTYRVHVPSKSCMQDSCKILAQSCMILQVLGPYNR